MDYLIKILAVVGGAALGWLLVGLVVRFVGRRLTSRDVPQPVLVAVRALGGVALGWLVWILVFSPGGSGLIGGGGSIFGGKGAESDQGKQLTTTRTSNQQTAAQSATTVDPDKVLRIVMLGGRRVVNERFYLIAGDQEALNLAELKKKIAERRQASPLEGIDVLIYENSVARDHPAAKDLEDWAKQHDLSVSLSFPSGDAP